MIKTQPASFPVPPQEYLFTTDKVGAETAARKLHGALYGALVIASTVGNLSQTLTEATDLTLSANAGESWLARYSLDIGGALDTFGIKFDILVPSGSTKTVSALLIAEEGTTYATSTDPEITIAAGSLAGATVGKLLVDVVVSVGDVAGPIAFNWAKTVADLGGTSIYKGSSVVFARL